MANYNPPLENLPIFDNAMFIHADIPITQADADKRYLRFPNAQGTENLLTINVAGLASMLSGLDVVDGTNKTNIDQSGINLTIDNNVNNGTIILKANDTGGTERTLGYFNSQILTLENQGTMDLITTGGLNLTGNTIGINCTTTTTLIGADLNLTTTNPPTCSAPQPAANDATTKIPTTAWVQSAITGSIPTSLLGLNNTWTGTQNWTNVSVGSLTSSAVQPASNDATTKIPTTAWVQSAISAIPAPFTMPTGSIIAFAGNTYIPSGWLKCDATPLSTATYPSLFSVIGYTYGGSGGTFYAPNLINKFIQGNTTSAGGATTGDFTVDNSNITATSVTSTAVGQTPIVFNSPSGIGNWAYIKGKPSGDSSQNMWLPYNNSSSSNGNNLVSSFTTPIGVATPTPLIGTVPSLLMIYIIKA